MKNLYPAIFSKSDDGYIVTFPDLKGCITEADTLEKAFECAKESLGLYLDGLKDIPIASKAIDIELSDNQQIMLVDADIEDNIIYFKKAEVQKAFEQALEKKGYTKYQVAQILGVDRSFIGRIAKGSANPSVDMAKRIGTLLGIDWQIFYS